MAGILCKSKEFGMMSIKSGLANCFTQLILDISGANISIYKIQTIRVLYLSSL